MGTPSRDRGNISSMSGRSGIPSIVGGYDPEVGVHVTVGICIQMECCLVLLLQLLLIKFGYLQF